MKHIESKHPCDECQNSSETVEETSTNCEEVNKEESCIHRDLSTLRGPGKGAQKKFQLSFYISLGNEYVYRMIQYFY